MKSVFATLTFVIVCCSTMLVIGKVAKMKSSAEDEVRAAMSQRTKAGNDGDVKTIENTMADDYVQTDIFGRVQTKSEWLADYYKPMAELIKKNQFHWDVWDEKDVQIRIFGDTAVVIGILTLTGKGASIVPGRGWVASPESTIGPLVLHFTRVWIKRDGRWLVAAVHNATVPEQLKK